MDRLWRGVLAGSLLCLASIAYPQEYPTRPITLIVAFPAGGSTDLSMRAFAEAASRQLNVPVLIENRTGGGGTIGPGSMAQTAKPDGYTLAQMPLGVFRVPHMQKVAFDPIRDLATSST